MPIIPNTSIKTTQFYQKNPNQYATVKDLVIIADTVDSIQENVNAGGGGSASFTGTSGITAFAGGGQASATVLTTNFNRVDTVASTNDSVKFAAAVAQDYRVVQNYGANDLFIYPAVGETFYGEAVNDPITLAPGNQLVIYCYNAGVWTI